METTNQSQNYSSCRGIILMYHRVTKASQDNWLLNVSPVHFEEQMSVIKKYGQPLKLQDILEERYSLRKKGIVLTFDDGYGDNYYNAKPILERHDIPATFFIVSGTIDSKEEYWWDELEKIIYEDDIVFPERYHIGGKQYIWPRASTSSSQLLQGLAAAVKPLAYPQQQEFMRALRSLNGKVKPHYLPLTQHELLELAQCGLFEIGAHTVTHPTLASLSRIEQEEEIAQSKEDLEELLNCPVTSFAYPYGSYSDLSIEILKDLGFKYGLTVTDDQVFPSCDPYQMPRFAVRDWSGEEFEKNLQKWL